MDIISRGAWGAKYQDGYDFASLPAPNLVLHHSATIAPDLIPPFSDDDAAIRELERIGQERFGAGMSYTFAITPSGRVYQGVSINRASAHTKNHNFDARAIVLVGNYQTHLPSISITIRLRELVVFGYEQKWWSTRIITGGHKDLEVPGYTECPGQYGEQTMHIVNNSILHPPLPPKQELFTMSQYDDIMKAIHNLSDKVDGIHKAETVGDGATVPRNKDSHGWNFKNVLTELDSLKTKIQSLMDK